jgi:hypothetical protein
MVVKSGLLRIESAYKKFASLLGLENVDRYVSYYKLPP